MRYSCGPLAGAAAVARCCTRRGAPFQWSSSTWRMPTSSQVGGCRWGFWHGGAWQAGWLANDVVAWPVAMWCLMFLRSGAHCLLALHGGDGPRKHLRHSAKLCCCCRVPAGGRLAGSAAAAVGPQGAAAGGQDSRRSAAEPDYGAAALPHVAPLLAGWLAWRACEAVQRCMSECNGTMQCEQPPAMWLR